MSIALGRVTWRHTHTNKQTTDSFGVSFMLGIYESCLPVGVFVRDDCVHVSWIGARRFCIRTHFVRELLFPQCLGILWKNLRQCESSFGILVELDQRKNECARQKFFLRLVCVCVCFRRICVVVYQECSSAKCTEAVFWLPQTHVRTSNAWIWCTQTQAPMWTWSDKNYGLETPWFCNYVQLGNAIVCTTLKKVTFLEHWVMLSCMQSSCSGCLEIKRISNFMCDYR